MGAEAVIRMPDENNGVMLRGHPMAFLVTGEDTRHTSMFDWTIPAGCASGRHVHRLQREALPHIRAARRQPNPLETRIICRWRSVERSSRRGILSAGELEDLAGDLLLPQPAGLCGEVPERSRDITLGGNHGPQARLVFRRERERNGLA